MPRLRDSHGASDTTLPQRTPVAPARDELGLAVLFSPDRRAMGKVVRLGERPISLGRGVGESDLGFDDPRASRWHATVAADAEVGHVLRDDGSRNGSRVNGEEVTAVGLSLHDVVRVGDTVLAVVPLDLKAVGWSAPKGRLLRGRSLALRRVYDRVDRVARRPLTVLIQGETGTGKELVAREVHRASGRSKLVSVNCAALPDALVESELFGHVEGAYSGATSSRGGLVRAADGGTLFLDEVSELSPAAQAKLLRVLETKRVRSVGADSETAVDARVVAATNRDLRTGGFRADLLARLQQWVIEVPPLRERREDLFPIAEAVLRDGTVEASRRLTADAFEALALAPWEHNVRSLMAVLNEAVLAAEDGAQIDVQHLGCEPPVRAADVAEDAVAAATTRVELEQHLRLERGNVTAVARRLGTSRTQIYRMLERHGVDARGFRRRG